MSTTTGIYKTPLSLSVFGDDVTKIKSLDVRLKLEAMIRNYLRKKKGSYLVELNRLLDELDNVELTPKERAAKQRRLDALVAGIDEPMLKAVKKLFDRACGGSGGAAAAVAGAAVGAAAVAAAGTSTAAATGAGAVAAAGAGAVAAAALLAQRWRNTQDATSDLQPVQGSVEVKATWTGILSAVMAAQRIQRNLRRKRPLASPAGGAGATVESLPRAWEKLRIDG